jgi:hypothetical protein
MKQMKNILFVILVAFGLSASAQQVNPVPDYTFANRMSAGRNTVTDTAAYFSIGPRYGAIRGMMPPMVVDTASVTGTKRNGLLIFSVQKNKFLYWDSVRVQWSDMAGSSGSYIVAGDTASMLLPYLRKADTTAMLAPYLKESDTVFLSNRINLKVNISDTATMLAPYLKESDTAFLSNRINLKVNISDTSSMLTNYVRHAGYGLTKSGQAFLVDTAAMATRARVQKGIDSVASIAGSGFTGSGTTNYVAKFTGTKALGNSQIFDNGTNVGIGTTAPTTLLDVSGQIKSRGNLTEFLLLERPIDFGVYARWKKPTKEYILGLDIGNNGGKDFTIYDATAAAFRLSISDNGNILINTSTDAGYKTDIAGTLRSTLGANFATTSGNVGIGTASPSAKFENITLIGTKPTLGDVNENYAIISGDSRTGTTSVSGNYAATLVLASNTNTFAANSGASLSFHSKWNSALYTSSAQFASIFGGKENSTDGSLAGYLSFATRPTSGNPTERMRITSDGEVLIGTTSDAGAYALQVAGSIYNTTGGLLAATGGSVTIGATGANRNLFNVIGQGAQTKFNTGAAVDGRIEYEYNSSRRSLFNIDNTAVGFQNESGVNFYLNVPELLVGTTTDIGDYRLQVNGNERIAGKLDIITTTEYGVNLGRTGTSATAFQAYNSTAAMAVGIESSTGGGLFTGTSAYAAVFGNANNYPTQFITNNTVRATITASGNLLIGTATDNGLGYKLQVNGGIYANNTIQAKAAQVSIDSASNLSALYISQHSITGSSTQPMMQSDVTLNTTGDVNLVNYTITNTASGANTNWLRFSDGSNIFRVTKAAEVVTAAPTGGSTRKWKLGEAATVSPTSPNRTIRVEIDGTVYYLHAKTTND